METVNNLTAAASRAVFGTGTTNTAGESAGQEPVSGGALGDVKKGEPYDMGNIEAETGEGTEPVAGEKGDVKKGEPFDLGNAEPQPKTTNDGTSQAGASGSSTEPTPDAFKGPGPQPVETKIGGSGTSNDKLDTEDGKGGRETEEKGTGEKYVKSSGVKADAGDFDAGKPGAGKEADRILAEKGTSHEPNATDSKGSDKVTETDGSPAAKKEKVSLKDKIKAKLHRHKE